jgi:heptosyltransferase III
LSTKGKILVIRGGAIGDFILTLPVLSAVRAQFPNTHLEVLGYPHIAQLALAGGLVDKTQSIEARALAGFFARNGELDRQLCDYFSEFNVILSYLYDPDEIFETNLARCSKAQFIEGVHRPSEGDSLHATEIFLKPLERLAIFDADPVPRLEFARPLENGSSPALASGSRCSQLGLHPGSGSELKNWPEEKWAELLTTLCASTDLSFLLLGGEAEGERVRRLAGLIPPDRLQLAESLPLVEVGRMLRSCSGFIGHDSGITHLAAAVGLKGIVLWGHTNERIWRPLSPEFRILQEEKCLADLPVSRVTDALFEVLNLKSNPVR